MVSSSTFLEKKLGLRESFFKTCFHADFKIKGCLKNSQKSFWMGEIFWGAFSKENKYTNMQRHSPFHSLESQIRKFMLSQQHLSVNKGNIWCHITALTDLFPSYGTVEICIILNSRLSCNVRLFHMYPEVCQCFHDFK